MKPYILLLFFCLAIYVPTLGQRLNVSGKVTSDTLTAKNIKLSRGTNNQLLSAAARPITLGTRLHVSNGEFRTNIDGLPLTKSVIGTSPRFVVGTTTDTLIIPFASATSSGLLNKEKQTFAGQKLFLQPVNIIESTGLVINNSPATLPPYWQMFSNGLSEFTLLRGDNYSNAQLTISQLGQFAVSDSNNTGNSASIYSNGTIEAKRTLYIPGGAGNMALAANGTTRKFTIYDGNYALAPAQQGFGLNTTAPNALFEVRPTFTYDANNMVRVSSNGNAAITINNDGLRWIGLTFSRNNAEVRFFGMPGVPGGYDHLYTAGSDGTNNLNLGINTPSFPTEKLDVNGIVKADAFLVGQGSATTLLAGNGTGVTLANNLGIGATTKTVIVNGTATTQSVNELNIVSSIRSKITQITSTNASNTSIDCSVDYVLIGGSNLFNQNLTITLPSPATCRGKRIVIKNYIGRNNSTDGIVTVNFSPVGSFFIQNVASTPASSLSIEPATTKALVSDGSNWHGAGTMGNGGTL